MSVLQQGVDAVGIGGQETPLGAPSKTSHVLHVVSNRVRDRLQKVQIAMFLSSSSRPQAPNNSWRGGVLKDVECRLGRGARGVSANPFKPKAVSF